MTTTNGVSGLTFSQLREANKSRLPHFKNRKGEPAHDQPDGSDWSLSEWCNAVCGELGEAANIIKKIRRGDMTLEEARGDLANELADVQTYLDILAFRAGIDLGRATIEKFNEVSIRVGCKVRLGDYHSEAPEEESDMTSSFQAQHAQLLHAATAPNTNPFDLAIRFCYHAPKGDQAKRYGLVRDGCLNLAKQLLALTPFGPEQDRCLDALDQVMFLANAAIARRE